MFKELEARWNRIIRNFKIATRFLIETWKGLRNDTFPYLWVGPIVFTLGLGIYFHLDYKIIRNTFLGFLYPENHPIIYLIFASLILFFTFCAWGARRAGILNTYLVYLTKVFKEAGLKTPLGRLPSYISDDEINPGSRKLTLLKNGITLKEFIDAKAKLAESMHCFIEEIRESRENGNVEILYAEKDFEVIVHFDYLTQYPNYSFLVGVTRTGKLVKNLSEVPHFLIGGTSNLGKSNCIRQILVTLYLNNPTMQITIIDLKSGLESIIFNDLPRINCITEPKKAIKELEKIEKLIKDRAEILLANNCQKIEEFFNIPVSERKYPANVLDKSLSRHFIIIDEATELLLASQNLNADAASKAKRIVQTLAAQGRAVGLHILISTQRPEMKNVDMSIKTNLQGRICFYMTDNASSMTILDSKIAADLPNRAGRAIWRNGYELLEIQVPMLTKEDANKLLDGLRVKKVEEISKNENKVASNTSTAIDLEKES